MFSPKSDPGCLGFFCPKKPSEKSFKEKKTFEQRVAEVEEIKTKFPTKIPIIVERYKKDSELPDLDKSKFLVPNEITIGQFISILRSRLRLPPSKSLFLLINGRSLPDYSASIGLCYEKHRDPDGFLYLHYAAQEAFG